MKKEYIILIALILILSGYLVFHKEDNDNTVIPKITPIEAQKITGLEIRKKDNTIHLVKKGDQWRLKDIDRPADNTAVDNMLDAFKKFKLSALVSQKGDVIRYELDDAHKIVATALNGDQKLFTFTMGKTAPTFNHTFVMLENDKNIYHASGNFRAYFEKSTADLRDKKVVEFKEKSIKKVSLDKDGVKVTLTAVEEKDKDGKVKITWSREDKTAVDKDAVSNLMSSLAFLECESFLPADKKAGLEATDAFCRIDLENDKPIHLALYKTKDAEKLSGISSMTPDAFVLSKFNGNDIVKNINTLLGIKEKNSEKTN